jgi:5-bromo-4-chloroindolyl phosphate hydrolysis protein
MSLDIGELAKWEAEFVKAQERVRVVKKSLAGVTRNKGVAYRSRLVYLNQKEYSLIEKDLREALNRVKTIEEILAKGFELKGD